MDFLLPFLLGIVVAAVTGIFTGFFNAAGSHLWDRVRKRIDPSPSPPRERYFVTQHQFEEWTGESRTVYETRRREGYEFSLQVEDRVPALESEGWERMIVNNREIWWRNPSRVACAFLMRRPDSQRK
jgi:hypothetical protein